MSSRQFTVRACVAAALIAGTSAALADTVEGRAGYLTSSSGDAVTDPFGLCWHTGEWQPGMHFDHCEPRSIKAAAVAQPPKKPAAKARVRAG